MQVGGALRTIYDAGGSLSEAEHGGAYTLCLRAEDDRGNGTGTSLPVRVDAEGPAVTLDPAPTTGGAVFTGAAGTDVRDAAPVRIRVWRGRTLYGSDDGSGGVFVGEAVTIASGGRWTTGLRKRDDTTVDALGDGDYFVQVTQCDVVGNCRDAGGTFRVAAGAAAPATPAPAPAAPVKPERLTARSLLDSAVKVLQRGKLRGLGKRRTVTATTQVAGRVQVVVFEGKAPARVSAYAIGGGRKAKGAKLPARVLAAGTTTVRSAGKVRVRVAPTRRGRRAAARRTKLAVTVRTIVVPLGGKAVASDRPLTLKRG